MVIEIPCTSHEFPVGKYILRGWTLRLLNQMCRAERYTGDFLEGNLYLPFCNDAKKIAHRRIRKAVEPKLIENGLEWNDVEKMLPDEMSELARMGKDMAEDPWDFCLKEMKK